MAVSHSVTPDSCGNAIVEIIAADETTTPVAANFWYSQDAGKTWKVAGLESTSSLFDQFRQRTFRGVTGPFPARTQLQYFFTLQDEVFNVTYFGVGTANGIGGTGGMPAISPGGVANAASFSRDAAPGSIISIFGTNLAQSTATATTARLPAQLGGSSLTNNGAPAPLFYANQCQINAQLPFEAQPGTATAIVSVGGAQSASTPFTVRPAVPGIFKSDATRCAVQNQDLTVNATGNPAPAGSIITAYLTGQGPLDHPVPTGTPAPQDPLSRAVLPAMATIGTAASEIQFLGLSPGSVGLLQANLIVPDLPSGDYPLRISIGGVASNTCLVAVAPKP